MSTDYVQIDTLGRGDTELISHDYFLEEFKIHWERQMGEPVTKI